MKNNTEIIENLDPGISEIVYLLITAGFETFTSCEGGDGHAFQFPTARITPKEDMTAEAQQLAKALTEAGYTGFYIKQVNAYQGEPIPWQPGVHSFIEVEFWYAEEVYILECPGCGFDNEESEIEADTYHCLSCGVDYDLFFCARCGYECGIETFAEFVNCPGCKVAL